MEAYAKGADHCATQVDYSDKGEDWYLGLCMALLHVPGEEEPSLLSDWHDDAVREGSTATPCDTLHAAFHPYKLWDDHMECLCQSGYDTPNCRTLLLATTTVTSTTRATTRTSTGTSTTA